MPSNSLFQVEWLNFETFLRSGPSAFLQFLLPNGPHSDLTFILRHLSNWFRVAPSIVLHGCKTTGYTYAAKTLSASGLFNLSCSGFDCHETTNERQPVAQKLTAVSGQN